MTWYYLTYYLLISSGLVIGLARYRRLARSSKLLLPLLALTLAVELVTEFSENLFSQSVIIYAFFQPIEFALLTGAYYVELVKRSWLLTIPAYAVLAIVNTLLVQPHLFPSNMLLVTQLITSMWALTYLRAMLQYPTQAQFTDFTLFWASCGLLVFNTSCLLLYGGYNFLDKSVFLAMGQLFRIVRIVANHILYFTFLLSILSKQNSLETPSDAATLPRGSV